MLSVICLLVFLVRTPASVQRGSTKVALELLSQQQRFTSPYWKTVSFPSHFAYKSCNTSYDSTSTRGTKHLTHRKLFSNAIRCLLTRSLLYLQLGQEAPQYPGLMFHDLLHSTLPGIGHLSQACQDTEVLAHRSWIRVPKACVQGGGTSVVAAAQSNFSTATLTSRN